MAGANSRRIRKALEPLLGAAHLSKSAVSRVVGRLKGLFEAWNRRDLSNEVSVPVLAVLGVAEDGTKLLISLRVAASEAAGQWFGVLIDLQKRGLYRPLLLVVDGHAGLGKAPLDAFVRTRAP